MMQMVFGKNQWSADIPTSRTNLFRIVMLTGLFYILGVAPITAQVSWDFQAPAKVVEGQSFNIVYSLENAQGSNFKAPSFNNFSVVSGPSYVTNTSIINGVSTSSFQIRYSLLASKAGRFSVAPATIVVGGKSMSTTSKTIEVVKGNSNGKDSGGQPYFVRMKLSTDSAFIGQQVVVDYLVYYKQQIQLNRFLRESAYDGFYAEEITQRESGRGAEIVDGEAYQVAKIKSVAIYPQRLGEHDIESAVVSIGIPDKEASRRMFFLRSMKSVNLTCEGGSLLVLPQPFPAPKSYSNGVGQYTMSSQFGKDTRNGNESYVIRMKVVGDGDRRLIEDPDIDLGSDFEVYAPEVYTEDFKVRNERVEHEKIWSYIVVPKKKGSLKMIPHFSYLDDRTGDFITLAPDTFYVHVDAVSGSPDFAIVHEDAQVDYLSYESGSPITRVFNTPIYWSLLGSSMLMLGFLYVRNVRQDKLENLSLTEKKKRKAKNAFDASIPKLQSLKETKSGKEFYAELSIGINHYLSSKHGVDTSKKTESIIKDLGRLFVNDDRRSSAQELYRDLMSTCEMAVYAFSSSNVDKMDADLGKAEQLVDLLER